MILNYVSSMPALSLAEARQFAVAETSEADEAEPVILVVSYWHSLRADVGVNAIGHAGVAAGEFGVGVEGRAQAELSR
jgi:hypothetical protein